MTIIRRIDHAIDIPAFSPEHVRPLLFQTIEQRRRRPIARTLPKTCGGNWE
jgi:hypothetical protein